MFPLKTICCKEALRIYTVGILQHGVFTRPSSGYECLYVTWSLRWSVSSWYSASCFFHCSTLLLASCSAATSFALLSCKVKSSASRLISHMDLMRGHSGTAFIFIWCFSLLLWPKVMLRESSGSETKIMCWKTVKQMVCRAKRNSRVRSLLIPISWHCSWKNTEDDDTMGSFI